MKLKEVLTPDLTARQKELAQAIRTELNRQIESMCNGSVAANDMFYKYICNDKSALHKIDELLRTDFPIRINDGYHSSSSMYVKSAKSIRLYDYIAYKYNFDCANGKRKAYYNADAYRDICITCISMLIQRYDLHTLSDVHILYNCFMVYSQIFLFYQPDNCTQYVGTPADILSVYYAMLECNTSVYDLRAQEGGYYSAPTKPVPDFFAEVNRIKKRLQPKCLKDLTACYNNDCLLSQAAKRQAIMQAYDVSASTARQWMHKFGLTAGKYTRKDYISDNNGQQSTDGI